MSKRRVIWASVGGYYSGDGHPDGHEGRMMTIASSHDHTNIIKDYQSVGFTVVVPRMRPDGKVKDNGADFSTVSTYHGKEYGEISRERYEARYGVVGFKNGFGKYSNSCREIYKATDIINARSYNAWDMIKAIIFG